MTKQELSIKIQDYTDSLIFLRILRERIEDRTKTLDDHDYGTMCAHLRASLAGLDGAIIEIQSILKKRRSELIT